MSQTLKRLELRLPEDHPIFDYPAGTRSQIAKMWLDIGARLASLEERIAALEVKGVRTEGQDHKGSTQINTKNLIDAIEGAFE
ncbi:MAG: hypothetical protein H0Z39_08765 [Peptococcaceae bacterium]|nr:hypothetical protein [Peptococcaceae bacterium]